LPDEYATKVDMLITLGETDMLKLQNQLLQAEAAIVEREESTGQVVFSTNARRPKPVCSYCGRNGHTREKCWFLNGLPPHLQNKHRKPTEEEENIALCTNKSNSYNDTPLKNCWIIDSSATAHVCSQQELLSEATDIGKTQKVYVGNGHAVIACKEGRVELAKHIQMQNVLLCPELEFNLISVSKLIEKGCNVYFENESCNVWRGKKLLFTTLKVHGLYVLQAGSEKALSTLDWHRKLAHFGQMNKLKSTVVGIPPDEIVDIQQCDTCIRAKQTRQVIVKEKDENSADIGELIHMDLMGPISPEGMNGEKYILSILDERSKVGIAKPPPRKSDTVSSVISVLKQLERQTGNKVKRIRCDRGKEFLNEELKSFLRSNGI